MLTRRRMIDAAGILARDYRRTRYPRRQEAGRWGGPRARAGSGLSARPSFAPDPVRNRPPAGADRRLRDRRFRGRLSTDAPVFRASPFPVRMVQGPLLRRRGQGRAGSVRRRGTAPRQTAPRRSGAGVPRGRQRRPPPGRRLGRLLIAAAKPGTPPAALRPLPRRRSRTCGARCARRCHTGWRFGSRQPPVVATGFSSTLTALTTVVSMPRPGSQPGRMRRGVMATAFRSELRHPAPAGVAGAAMGRARSAPEFRIFSIPRRAIPQPL